MLSYYNDYIEMSESFKYQLYAPLIAVGVLFGLVCLIVGIEEVKKK